MTTAKNKDTITSDAARASSAHSRINIPINLENWEDVPQEFHEDMLWFHQHVMDTGMSWKTAQEALKYDNSSIFKFLKGTSTGSYANFVQAIKSYKRIALKRKTIQQQTFVHNSITDVIFSALDYTFTNLSMTLIVGDSGMGKSTAMKAWRDENNHGRSVYVDCPPVGGIKGFLGAISHACGGGTNHSIPDTLRSICRAFNPQRILLLDNMHRALPARDSSPARVFDIIQHVQEESGCAVGMSATARLDSHMRGSTFMFEQITGRIGTPVYVPASVSWADIKPIVIQYVPRPSKLLQEHCMAIANGPGRIRQLVERWKLASRVAGKDKQDISEDHFLKAEAIRRQLSKHNLNQRKA